MVRIVIPVVRIGDKADVPCSSPMEKATQLLRRTLSLIGGCSGRNKLGALLIMEEPFESLDTLRQRRRCFIGCQ